MPAHKLSRAERALNGTEQRNPARYARRAESSGVRPLGSCPKHLTPNQKDLWKELVSLAPPGVLSAADRFSLETLVRLLERSRNSVQRVSEIAVMVGLLSKFGMTPESRQRLDIQPPDEPDADGWDELD